MHLEEFDLLEEKITDLLAKFEIVKKDNISLKKDIAAKNEIINALEKEASSLREDKNKLDSLLKDNRIQSLIKNIDTAISENSYVSSNEKKDMPKTNPEPKVSEHQNIQINQTKQNITEQPATIKIFENKTENKTDFQKTNENVIKPSSQNDIESVSEDEDPFSNADDNSWDKDIEKTAETKTLEIKEAPKTQSEEEYEDEYLFGDDDDEFAFEENK